MTSLRFLGRRAIHSIVVLFAISFLSLALVKVTPGDYFDSARIDPRISMETLAAMRSRQGLDKALPLLYWRWICSAAKGDWGFSFAYNSTAGQILRPRVVNTFLLAASATLLAWIISLPAGMAAAVMRGRFADKLISAVTILLLAIPELVFALGLFLIAARTHSSFANAEVSSANLMKRLLAPALCLTAGLVPMLVSHMRTGVAGVLEAPFVAAARSFGTSEVRILFRWVLPASLNAMISLFGLSVGLLMSSSLVVEGVFAWPGLGQLMLQAIFDRDIFLIVDSAVIAAGFLLAGNFAADALLYVSDPRIRRE
jgi:peptide/nickel transport system permease protein